MAAQKSEHPTPPLDQATPAELEDFVGYNLKRAYMVVQAEFNKALEVEGFSPRVFSALSLVVQFPNITQSALARTLDIERSGLVAIIDQLENRQLVTRTTVSGDRRVQALVPSATGIASYQAARDKVRDSETRLFSHMTTQEKSTLLALLKKTRATKDTQ